MNIGEEGRKQTIFISALFKDEFIAKLIGQIRKHRGCFAWDYHEILGLYRDVVPHRLPMKKGFKPNK